MRVALPATTIRTRGADEGLNIWSLADGHAAPFLNHTIDAIVQFETFNAPKVEDIRTGSQDRGFVEVGQEVIAQPVGCNQMGGDRAVAAGAADRPQVAPIDAAALDLAPRDTTATETQQTDFDEDRGLTGTGWMDSISPGCGGE